jgi:tRNA(fMet)-specific endonuclease VapC
VRKRKTEAAELRYGCAKSGSKRLLKIVEDLLGENDVLPLELPFDAEYDQRWRLPGV